MYEIFLKNKECLKIVHNCLCQEYVNAQSSVLQNIEINWLVTKDKLTGEFLEALESQPSDLSNTAIFMAVEASVLKQLKSHLNNHCQYKKSKLYASAYWNHKKKA